jgi:large repetitive protein
MPIRWKSITNVFLACAYLVVAQAPVSTFTGNGTCGFSGDNGPAAQAQVCNPGGAVSDSIGNIYFVDAGNWRIRKISAAGAITTVAGNGTRGTSGDGGPATSASIGAIQQLAADSTVLCFGDLDAHKLRCVLLGTGTIVGFGTGNPISAGDGGSLTNASFHQPSGIAFMPHSSGNSVSEDIYIADSADNIVRKIDGISAIITTVVGPGTPGQLGDGGPATSASLQSPSGLFTSPLTGMFYIADSGGQRVRSVSLSSGVITTVAGNGSAGYSGDGGAALAAQLNSPNAIAFDSSGNLYIADAGNLVARKVDVNGNISTIAGNGQSGFGADNIPAIQSPFASLNGITWDDPASLLLIPDGSNRIRQVNTTTVLTASPSPATPGSSVTLTATVSPAGETGTVSFYLGITGGKALLGSAAVSNGQATFDWTPSENGTLPLSATFGGDVPSTSAIVDLTVQAGSTTTTLTSTPNPSATGTAVTFTATVSSTSATGTVQFNNFNVMLGSAPVVNGIATFTTSTLAAGSTQVTAVYSGDAQFSGSQSPSITQVVRNATTTTLSVVGGNPSTYGQSVSLIAGVTPSSASGSVQFFNGTTLLGSANLSNGFAQMPITLLPVGTDTITANYLGDTNDFPSSSSTVQQTVNKAPTSTALTASPSTSSFGQTVTLTAAVTPALATGTVQFFNGATLLGSAAITNSQAQISTATLPVGTNSFTASYSGDANALASTSTAISLTVNPAASSVTLSSNPNPSNFGATVTLTVSVTPATATGAVQFLNGATPIGSANLSGGLAQITTSTLPVGTASLTASYAGDANDAAATSAAVQQVVNKAATTTTLASNQSTITLGGSVTLTVTVSPATATGTVQFSSFNGNSGSSYNVGSATVSGGVAILTTTALSSGPNSITAQYSGDAQNNSSTSAGVSVNVRFASFTVLSTDPNPSNTGAAVTLTATIYPANNGQTGSVQFFNGSALLGTANLAGGQAVFITSSLPIGADSLTATYSGDSSFSSSTSSAVQQTVNKASTTTSLLSGPNPSTFGAAVTLTASISPVSATGTVQFYNAGALLGSASLSGGQAQLATGALPVGANALTAVYSGDNYNAASTSAAIQQTVNKLATSTALSASPNPSTFGTSVGLTATVTPASATGTVQFYNGGTLLGSAALSAGRAQLSTSALPAGSDSLTATYSGDSNDSASSSSAVTQTVSKAATTTAIGASPSPSTFGTAVTLTATVLPAGATGSVQFFSGGVSLGSAGVSGGQAQLAITTLAAGVDSITASYSGDSNYSPSNASAISQTVNKAATSISLSSTPNPSTAGATVTLTSSVTPASATGSVQFFSGSTLLGTASLAGGQAQFSTSSLATGTDSLTAKYLGDSNDASSTSTAISQVVKSSTTTMLTSSPSTSTFGQSVTLTATVSPSSATGSVQFFFGATLLGSAGVSGGRATFSTAALPAGSDSLTAVYSGDSTHAGSTSPAHVQTVNMANTTTTLSASPSTATVGETVTFTAHVSQTSATGTVEFTDGGAQIGVATLGGGVATFSTSSLSSGTHSIRAVYSGDSDYNSSQSTAQNYRVH